MKILMISLDRSLLDPSSSSAVRMRRYAEAAGNLTVLVPGFSGEKIEYGKVRLEILNPWRFFSIFFFPPKIDLVTAQDPFWTGLISLIIARRSRARLEIQLHGDPWSGETTRFRRGWALASLRRADGIRVVSERLFKRLILNGIPNERVVKIPIGLDREGQAPRFVRLLGFETVFVYVGRLDQNKGLDILIDAFAEVARKNAKTVLLIVGDEPERAALERRVLSLELRTAVRFYGWMRDPRGVIAASDALVLPSWSEGWGRAPVEALAAGVPVIMTDVGLAGEYVHDGRNGLVTVPGDAKAISRALEKFASDRDLRIRLKAGVEESKRALPSFGKTISDVVAVWRSTIERPRLQKEAAHTHLPSRRAVIAVFLIALTARLLMFGLINARGEEFFYRFSDGSEYLQVARNLLEGHGFSVQTTEPYLPYSYFAPGYPYLLAAVMALGLGFIPVILLQDVAGAFTATLVTLFGWRIVGRRAAILAGVFLAIEPSTVFWTNQLVTESLSTVFLVGAFFTVAGAMRTPRLFRFIAVGSLLGLSTLIRHASQFLIPVFALASLWSSGKRRIAGAILVAVFGTALLIPWIIHNRTVLGTATYSTAGGTLGLGKTLQYYANQKYGKSLPETFPDFYPETYLSNPEANQHVESYAGRYPLLAWRVFWSDPLGIGAVYLKSFVPFFLGDGYAQIKNVLGNGKTDVIWNPQQPSLVASFIDRPDIISFIAGKIVWAALTAAALVGVIFGLARAESRRVVVLAVLVIAYYAVAAGVGGYSRFRFPVTPLILLLASSGIVTIWKTIRKRRDLRRLLVVTQVVDLDHPDLAFFHRWIEGLAEKFNEVDVVALSLGRHAFPANVRVFTPAPSAKIFRNLAFLSHLARGVSRADGVFFHMCPEYAIAAAPLAALWGKRTLLWYTHRSVTNRLKLAVMLVSKVFTASKESCRVASSKIEVTGHGIEVPPAGNTSSSSDFRILVVGRVTPIKSIPVILEAASLLNKRGKPVNVTIIGGPVYPSDGEHLAFLRSRVDALKIDSLVNFAGPLKHTEVQAAYRNADLLVNASPNGPDKVVYEAAAAGIPVVAAHPAFVSLFGPRVADLWFPEGDAGALADRISKLREQPAAERIKIGSDLRETVIRDHSLPRLIDKIVNFFL